MAAIGADLSALRMSAHIGTTGREHITTRLSAAGGAGHTGRTRLCANTRRPGAGPAHSILKPISVALT